MAYIPSHRILSIRISLPISSVFLYEMLIRSASFSIQGSQGFRVFGFYWLQLYELVSKIVVKYSSISVSNLLAKLLLSLADAV